MGAMGVMFPYSIINQTYIRPLIMKDGNAIIVNISSLGNIWNTQLKVICKSLEKISEDYLEEIKQQLFWMFDLDMNLSEFNEILDNDSLLHLVKDDMLGLKMETTPTGFEVLIKCICCQMISFNLAKKMMESLTIKFGRKIAIGNGYYTFPDPLTISNCSIQDLQKCKLSRQKSEYIRDIAHLVNCDELFLHRLRSLSNDQIKGILGNLKGIGPWTIELFLVWGLKRYDSFPASDVWGRRILSKFFFSNENISSETAYSFVNNRWGCYSGLAMYYLLRGREILAKKKIF